MTAPFMTDTTTNLAAGAMCQLCGDRKTASAADYVDAWAHQHLEDIHPGPYAYLLGVLANTAIIISEATAALADAVKRAEFAENQSLFYQAEFVTVVGDHERTAANLKRARAELRRYRGQMPVPTRSKRSSDGDLILKHLNSGGMSMGEFRRHWPIDIATPESPTPWPAIWPHQC